MATVTPGFDGPATPYAFSGGYPGDVSLAAALTATLLFTLYFLAFVGNHGRTKVSYYLWYGCADGSILTDGFPAGRPPSAGCGWCRLRSGAGTPTGRTTPPGCG